MKSYQLIIPKYYVYTSNSLHGQRKNHWTMKYRSQWPTFSLRSFSHGFMLIHQIVFKIIGKITEPWNIGHSDPLLFEVKHQVSLTHYPKVLFFIHQIVFKIWGKLTEPWNICHSDPLLFWGQAPSLTDLLSQGIMLKHQQSSRYKAKSPNLEKKVTVTNCYFEVKHQVSLTHYPKVSCLYIK